MIKMYVLGNNYLIMESLKIWLGIKINKKSINSINYVLQRNNTKSLSIKNVGKCNW